MQKVRLLLSRGILSAGFADPYLARMVISGYANNVNCYFTFRL